MIILAGVFGASWFVSTALAAHLLRLLEALGATPAEAIAAGALAGPAQVAAGIAEFGLLRRAAPLISTRLAASIHPLNGDRNWRRAIGERTWKCWVSGELDAIAKGVIGSFAARWTWRPAPNSPPSIKH